MKCPDGLSCEEILRGLQEFTKARGRLPKVNDPGLESLAHAAKDEFGSWENALEFAGLQPFEAWHRKRAFLSEIRRLLSYNPMTMRALREELNKCLNINCLPSRIALAVRRATDIKCIGPRRFRVYFLEDQEDLARFHLERILPKPQGLQEELFYCLRKPMTKSQVEEVLVRYANLSSVRIKGDAFLKDFMMAGLVYRVRFVAGNRGAKKYSSKELFGDLACKTYFCRLDCPEEVAELVLQNIPPDNVGHHGFRSSLSTHLKRILHRDAFLVLQKRIDFMHW